MATEFELLHSSGKEYIGFYGHPPIETLNKWRDSTGLELLDLDIYFGAPDADVLPKNYCRIIANIINNGVALKDSLRVVVAATGMEKCDSGRYAAWLLQKMGVKEIVYTTNEDAKKLNKIIVCSAQGRPKKRAVRIMETVYNPLSLDEQNAYKANQIKPTVGFWGTPPHPIELLDLFPDDTCLFGWTRCVEAGRPADLELESFVDDDLPVIFFAQSFCNKAQLALYLAKKHNGMFVDAHDEIHKSLAARIEAFIRLNT